MKMCRACQVEKTLSDFPPDKRSTDGTQARCRSCINEWIKIHYRKNPAAGMWRRARARAAKLGLAFDFEIEDLLPLPTNCPVFGTPLRVSAGPQDPHAYSLDRINNDRGYVKGNIVVMSYRANRLKNDGTAEDHEAIARWMKQTRERLVIIP
jgi:hypothetical protein